MKMIWCSTFKCDICGTTVDIPGWDQPAPNGWLFGAAIKVGNVLLYPELCPTCNFLPLTTIIDKLQVKYPE